MHSQLPSFWITRHEKTSSGKCSIATLSQFLRCQTLKASLRVTESPQPPAWTNPHEQRRQHHSFCPCSTHPSPALVMGPVRTQTTRHDSFSWFEAECPHGRQMFSLQARFENEAGPPLWNPASQRQSRVGSGLLEKPLMQEASTSPVLLCCSYLFQPRHSSKRFITLC